jgi:hypothetical protein
MTKRWIAATGAFVVAALSLGAVPAFTADTGTITVTITAQAPAAACIELATPPGASVSFGTRPFSRSNQTSTARGDVTPRFRNCGTTDANIAISGTDATGASAAWTLDPGFDYTCAASAARNTYLIAYFLDSDPVRFLGKSPTSLLAGADPGVDHDLVLDWFMPCEGSDGAGQTFSASILLTATVA